DDAIFVEADELLPDVDAGPDEVYCVVDENPDADIVYIPNIHTGNEDCPALSSAKFPYYDTDGTLHFCRKCDQVRKNDPQCVRNQWIESNKQLCTDYSQYDCYDYPCDMPWLKPISDNQKLWYQGLHVCDISLSPNPGDWDPGMYTFKHFNISKGKVGYFMANAGVPTSYRANMKLMEYVVADRRYRVRAVPAYGELAYHQGAYLMDMGSGALDAYSYFLFIAANDTYRVVYNQKIRGLSYTPVLTDKWAFANIQESDGAANKLSYAKVGVWKWTSLGFGTGNEPFIVDDRLVFYDDNFIGYYCDLDKSPQSLADCGKVNRDGEQIRFPVPDTEDNRLIYFETVTKHDRIVRLDLRGATPVYEELPLQEVETGTFMVPIHRVRGNLLSYKTIYPIAPADPSYENDGKYCFYRIDQKKSICLKPVQHIFDGKVVPLEYNVGYSDWENQHYLVWQTAYYRNLILRDMDCYCQKEGVCPLE
ncbi:MAG TPA: hypothetical protein P5077_10480, partial [bacterium]|nr:hypothetical protein [bacterium]